MTRPRRALLLVALATLVVTLPLLARSASAAVIVTSALPVAPAIGYASDGTFLAVWAEDRGAGTGLDLYAARTNAAGVAVGIEVPVLVAPGNQSDPALVFSEHNGAYLVIYTDDRTGGVPLPPTPGVPVPGTTTPGLPTPGGSTPGVPTPGVPTPGSTPPVPPPPPIPFALEPGRAVAAIGPAELDAPAMAEPSSGAAAGAWSMGSPALPDQPMPTIPPPTAGPPPTGIPPLPTPTTAPTALPGPTATPGGPVSPPTATGSRDLYGTWVAPTGQRITSTFAVVSSPADDTYPSLGYVRRPSGDEFALTWREVTGTASAIGVMRLDGIGFFFVPSAKYSVASGGDLGRPSVAGEAGGEYLVTWAQTAKDDPSRDVFARRLNSNCVPYGVPRAVVSGPADQAYPSIGSLGSAGGYILTWENRLPGDAPDIRVRRLNRNGVPYATEYDLAGGAPFSFAPNVASSDYPSTLVVWLDRNAAGDNSVLALQVTRDGRRLGPERLLVQGGAGPSGATPVLPPPVLPTSGPPLPTPPVPVPPVPPPLPTP
jgi:hypothetical protein